METAENTEHNTNTDAPVKIFTGDFQCLTGFNFSKHTCMCLNKWPEIHCVYKTLFAQFKTNYCGLTKLNHNNFKETKIYLKTY